MCRKSPAGSAACVGNGLQAIGASTTIDCGSMHDAYIGAGPCLDNPVRIGHKVRVGRGCVIVSQVGISGCALLEDHVVVGGQAGFRGHLRIGRGARIGAQAGATSDVPPGLASSTVQRARRPSCFAILPCCGGRCGMRPASGPRARLRNRRQIRTESDGLPRD